MRYSSKGLSVATIAAVAYACTSQWLLPQTVPLLARFNLTYPTALMAVAKYDGCRQFIGNYFVVMHTCCLLCPAPAEDAEIAARPGSAWPVQPLSHLFVMAALMRCQLVSAVKHCRWRQITKSVEALVRCYVLQPEDTDRPALSI